MSDPRFIGLSTEELADMWYALGGAETRHPGGFSGLVDSTLEELNGRLGDNLAAFLEPRYRQYRFVDSKEDAAVNAKAASEHTEGI
jgi:hypothetical protein